MLIDSGNLENNATLESHITVIGAGPAGIVLSLELEKQGYDVLLVESGDLSFSKQIQDLNKASYLNPQFHSSLLDCTRRQVGGASVIWGGRCVPYDPVDFDARDYIPYSSWPITYEEIAGYFQLACDYFFCGKSEFNIQNIPKIKQKSIIPDLPDDRILTSTLERWSLPTNFGKEYLSTLKQSHRIKLLYKLTCINIDTNARGTQVERIQAKTLNDKIVFLKSKKFVLACGGLNTTRLLLVSDRIHPGGIGNHSGLLGRFYMGHLSGTIAVANFTTPSPKTIFGFDRDADKVYMRRRFSFARDFLHEKKLINTVAWLGVPKFGDPSHRNGILSSAHIALNLPILKSYLVSTAIRNQMTESNYWPHIINILNNFGSVLTFMPAFLYRRFIAHRKIPSLFVYSISNKYPLHYHSEQVPNFDSRVDLSEEYDKLGMRKLNINLRYTQQDIDSVIRAHTHWDEHLRKYNCGYLKYITTDLEASIWEQAGDGFHQIGTTRMSEYPQDGVVDNNCKVHGINNLFVASSSVFVTSGQANSTFMIVAFALRLAKHLKHILRADF